MIDLKNYLNLNNVKFGNYDYITPKIDNTKAKKEYANLKLTTYQNIKKYLKKKKEKVIIQIKGKSFSAVSILKGLVTTVLRLLNPFFEILSYFNNVI